MKRLAALLLASLVGTSTSAVRAEEEDAEAHDEVPKELGELVLATGRPRVAEPEADLVRLQIHGEYQARVTGMAPLLLDATASAIDAAPGLVAQPLGQRAFASHWLRVTPRLQLREDLEIVGQLDVLTGVVVGDTAKDTRADATPRDDHDGFKNVQPRWLYAQWRTRVGLFRVGQQPNHLGMGLLANDGDHPSVFGDYRRGAISERVLFATRPGGKDHPLIVAVAGDLVFQDARTQLVRGDVAWQGVLAAYWDEGPNQLGAFAVLRDQSRARQSVSPLFPYTDRIKALAIAATGKFAAPIPGVDGFVYGAAELAGLFGSTNAVRTQDQALGELETRLQSWGGAVQLGFVRRAWAREAPARGDPKGWGDVVGQLEIGYASGDADPYDGTERRFLMDPNHRIGLLLFDEVMRWQTARAATAAQDPLLQNASRPTPGVDLLPSQGGVYGAQYVNPVVIVRPRRWLDLKGGMVLAQATADVVNPYKLATGGAYVNYRGGDARSHDLGLELDLGVEARAPLDHGLVLALGAQGGVLFPGRALADERGQAMPTPWIVVGRLGLLY